MRATSDFRGVRHLGQSHKKSLPGAGQLLGALAVTSLTVSLLDSETEPLIALICLILIDPDGSGLQSDVEHVLALRHLGSMLHIGICSYLQVNTEAG